MTSERDFLPFSRPMIGQAEIDEVSDCLESGWLATGPRVERFEQALREYLFAQHVVALSSGTAGLHLALRALRLEPGDEVLTTPLTFVATVNTIVQAGGRPVFVDIDPETRNLDVAAVESALTPRTRALLPVHFAGLSADLDPLNEIAGRHGLRVIEDAAHAVGAEYRGRRVGSFGDTQVFSFHPNKNLTTGEGGCITTSDPALARGVELARFHGIDRSGASPEQPYDVVEPGFKYGMMDLQAAIGLHQLKALDGFVARRAALAERYLEALASWPQLELPGRPGFSHRHAWHLFTPVLSADAPLGRSEFVEGMRARGIGIGVHYPAVHLFRYYQERFGYRRGDFPRAERVGERIVSLPLFPQLEDRDQDRVLEAMRDLLE